MAIVPNSDEEWELEQRAFAAANNRELPESVRSLVKDLWREICAREQWASAEAQDAAIW